jgi:hypothetical protein
MNPATPNEPKPAATNPAPTVKPPGHNPGAPIPPRHAPFPAGKSAAGSRLFPPRNVRPHIAPAAMRQQRHGRHDG